MSSKATTASNSQVRATMHVFRADYANPVHAAALVRLLDAYARDPMGGAHPLSDFGVAKPPRWAAPQPG